jgi:hypothetical protein
MAPIETNPLTSMRSGCNGVLDSPPDVSFDDLANP